MLCIWVYHGHLGNRLFRWGGCQSNDFYKAVAPYADSEFRAAISDSSASTQDYVLEEGDISIHPSSIKELISEEIAVIINLDT